MTHITNGKQTLELYDPKYNYKKAGIGIGLVGACLSTPGTNFAILFLFHKFIIQRPYNFHNFNCRITRIKFKMYSFLERI